MEYLLSFGTYFTSIFLVIFFSYRKKITSTEFIIGDRSLNYWVTAFAAHASDMSNWLFMGYPGMIFLNGFFSIWIAIGLTFCMFLNWHFIAPKLRRLTEKINCLTLSELFEHQLNDHSGFIHISSAIICFIFYSIYIAAGLVGFGLLIKNIFMIPYFLAVLIGLVLVILYVIIGGYSTLAWIDFFQGWLLLFIIVFVPIYLFPKIGGWTNIIQQVKTNNLTYSLLPDFSSKTISSILLISLGWGLGYFGQPHILTKFMGIKKANKIKKAKYIGITWMSLSLFAATFVGLIGIVFFKNTSISDVEMIFVEMVKQTFNPFFVGIALCAIVAAIINVTSSQMLILSTIITENFYKKLSKKEIPDSKLLLISRLGIIIIGIFALIISLNTKSSIFNLVLYAWSGLGASFGPLLIYCLLFKNINKYSGWTIMITGALGVILWPFITKALSINMNPLLPMFVISSIFSWIVAKITQRKVIQYENN